MTLDQAAGRWWVEKGQHLKTAPAAERRIERLLHLLGGDLRLIDITTPIVLSAVEARRAETFGRGQADDAPTYPLANRTVNLDVIDTLRPILRRAARAWGARGLPEIDWAELRLPEPKPKPKEFSDAELETLLAALPVHWRAFVRFAATYGCRLEEMFFHPAALDLADAQAARLTLRERKNDHDHMLPLRPADVPWLRARAERASDAALETIWFRELSKGRIAALSYFGAESAIRRALTATGLRAQKGVKGAHDLRRHAGMRILRATGNLRVAQRLLGHQSIQSTLVYAHAVESDVRAGLELVSRNSPTPASSAAGEKPADPPLAAE